MVGRPRLPWSRKRDEQSGAKDGASAAPAAAAAPAASTARIAPPLAREPDAAPHHWLTIIVARHGPVGPVPLPGARVVVRAYPRGAAAPRAPIGRGTTGPDGTLALLLPAGRYAVAATHERDTRAVTVTLEHAGRALLTLESLARRVALTIEAARPDGFALTHAPVEVRAAAGGAVVERGATDDTGVVTLGVPAGAYEVRVGGASVRTYVEADTLLRMTAEPAAADAAEADVQPITPYQQKVRAATQYAAPYAVANVRDEGWN